MRFLGWIGLDQPNAKYCGFGIVNITLVLLVTEALSSSEDLLRAFDLYSSWKFNSIIKTQINKNSSQNPYHLSHTPSDVVAGLLY